MKTELHAWQTRAVLVERSITPRGSSRLPHRLYICLAPLDEQDKPRTPPRFRHVPYLVQTMDFGGLPGYDFVIRDKAEIGPYLMAKRLLRNLCVAYNTGAKSWAECLEILRTQEKDTTQLAQGRDSGNRGIDVHK